MEIRKVLVRNDKVKYVIVPRKSEIQPGDLVLITNDLKMVNKFMEGEKDGGK